MKPLTMYIICALLILAIIITVISYQSKINSLNKEYHGSISTVKNYLKDQRSLKVGDVGIIRNYKLEVTSTGENFKVDFEVIITDVSEKDAKIQITDMSSVYSYAKDPSNHQSIINFVDKTWVSKSTISPIIGAKSLRNDKIEKLLNEYEDKEND